MKFRTIFFQERVKLGLELRLQSLCVGWRRGRLWFGRCGRPAGNDRPFFSRRCGVNRTRQSRCRESRIRDGYPPGRSSRRGTGRCGPVLPRIDVPEGLKIQSIFLPQREPKRLSVHVNARAIEDRLLLLAPGIAWKCKGVGTIEHHREDFPTLEIGISAWSTGVIRNFEGDAVAHYVRRNLMCDKAKDRNNDFLKSSIGAFVLCELLRIEGRCVESRRFQQHSVLKIDEFNPARIQRGLAAGIQAYIASKYERERKLRLADLMLQRSKLGKVLLLGCF